MLHNSPVIQNSAFEHLPTGTDRLAAASVKEDLPWIVETKNDTKFSGD